jgi:hypothetical protein
MENNFILWAIITSILSVIRTKYFWHETLTKEVNCRINIAHILYYLFLIFKLGLLNAGFIWIIAGIVVMLFTAEFKLNVAQEEE